MLCSNIDPFFVFIDLAWFPFPIRILTEEQTVAEFLRNSVRQLLKPLMINRSFVAQLASAFDC